MAMQHPMLLSSMWRRHLELLVDDGVGFLWALSKCFDRCLEKFDSAFRGTPGLGLANLSAVTDLIAISSALGEVRAWILQTDPNAMDKARLRSLDETLANRIDELGCLMTTPGAIGPDVDKKRLRIRLDLRTQAAYLLHIANAVVQESQRSGWFYQEADDFLRAMSQLAGEGPPDQLSLAYQLGLILESERLPVANHHLFKESAPVHPVFDWAFENSGPTRIGTLGEALRRCSSWGGDWENIHHRAVAERCKKLPEMFGPRPLSGESS